MKKPILRNRTIIVRNPQGSFAQYRRDSLMLDYCWSNFVEHRSMQYRYHLWMFRHKLNLPKLKRYGARSYRLEVDMRKARFKGNLSIRRFRVYDTSTPFTRKK